MWSLLVHYKPAGEHARAHTSAQERAALQVQVLREGIHIQGQHEAARRDQDLPKEVQGARRFL